MHRDKECPFSGVTSSGRVWRKVPESDVRSVWSERLGDDVPRGIRPRKLHVNIGVAGTLDGISGAKGF